ncbi:MAG: tetratricopeptide repeat protein [Caldilineaceae bacterium]|nr:tetratricopeptide repeat protein [Caldilineaceae bacterium]
MSLGQHREAREIFEKLLADQSTPAPVRDQAWFYLGKVLYAAGLYDASERALRSVTGSLPVALDSERRLLLAQGLMYRERFDAAVAELDGWAARGTGPPMGSSTSAWRWCAPAAPSVACSCWTGSGSW